MRLQKSGATGRNWYEDVNFVGQFTRYCLSPIGHRTVTATFPDGRVYRFEAASDRPCQTAGPISAPTMVFQQTNATATTAGATLVPVGDAQVQIDGAVPGQLNLLDTNGQVYNPTQFRLTTQDGYTYDLDEKLGVTKITEPNGAYATFTTNGIFHSSGKSVTFIRNSTGQITQITDPNGNFVKYTYGFGTSGATMTAFTDAAGKVTNYGYTAVSDGFVLATISDTRGTLLTNTWVNNRLTATTDIFGKTTSYNHDTINQVETVTDRNNNPTTYTYDDHGNVTQMVDALNNITTYTYDENDNKLSETNALGKTTSFSYDGRGNRASETDPLGHSTNYTYNGRGQVVTVKDPLGRITTNGYDQQGNLTTTTDARNQTTTTEYNASGLPKTVTDAINGVTQFEYTGTNLTKQTDALNHVSTYTYDSSNNKQSQTVSRVVNGVTENLTTTYEYDKDNRLTKTINPDTTFTRVVYNALGQQSESYDALNHKTTYEYDNGGRLSKTTFADATFEQFTYDNEGRKLTSRDRAGRVTTFEYDKLGRLTKTIYPDTSFTRTVYDAAGQVKETYDQLNHKTTYGYDDAGRRTSITNALNQTTSFTYDDAGNQLSVTDANQHTTTYVYDELGRRKKTIYHDGSFDESEFDALGRQTAKIDQAGKRTEFGYDALGRLTTVTQYLNGVPLVTTYGYDELGNRITQTDAKQHTTYFTYDKLGRRSTRTLPLGQSESYTYDAAGNLKTRTDFNGRTTTYNYDLLNRLSSKVADSYFSTGACAGGACGATSVGFTYTADGKRQTMTDLSGTTTYTYEPFTGRLQSKQTPEGTLSYTYDLAGNLKTTQSSNSGGASVTYTYDELNRLKTAADSSGTTTYNYDSVGNLQNFIYPNGVTHTYTYDELNRLKNLDVACGTAAPGCGPAGQALSAQYTYTLGLSGNRTSVTELTGRKVTYGYDDLYRLTSESISCGTGFPACAQQLGAIGYTYDAVGNRQSMTSTVPNLTPAGLLNYDANDRQTTDANETYDANGNTASSGAVANVYDFENKLVQRGTIAIVYDGDGNRVRKTAGGLTTKYLVDTNNLTGYAQVLDETQSGTVVRKYTYGLDLIAQTQSVGTSFYGYDGHGSVRQLTNVSGAVTDTYTYDAFGNLLERAGHTPNLYLYAGEQFDPDLGLYYNRARYLDVRQGRFWGMDPSLVANNEATYLHAYLYADSNPVNAIDPTGLYTQDFGYAVEREVQKAYESDFSPSPDVSFGAWAMVGPRSRRSPYSLKPDILDRRLVRGDGSNGMVWLEIKPLSISGMARAASAWTLYDTALTPFGFSPDIDWLRSGRMFTVQNQDTLVFNVGGILFYTTSKQDYDRFEDAIVVFANTVGAIGIGAGAGQLVNALLPEVPRVATAGAEVIDISTKAAFATRASSAQSKVDTVASELLAVSGF